ncbi:cytochrome c oxidase subunit II [Tenuibacillus multivorans]|uniref:Cytochrome aa3 subunit 2 n=1 Tax=Tenuibacillus multivorans TaxID=237069 RepID=A0A1H0B3G5_9BACI|nr:cytochrome c oxidase subunit II [Tenuibacillus multivorans]GEL77555.1 cytochrome c oxidase subunit II [Tenuibacillus multivorans]SDN39883.1 cytochrome c oxidase subunit 2 [Tenuibacillus multivorans]
MHMHKLEKVWLIIGVITLIAFLTTVGIQAFASGHAPPSDLTKVDPEKVDETPPFNEPGLKKVGENEYELVMVLQSFGFTPNKVEIPHGSTVKFIVTSKDVVHGFEIAGTRVNMMVTPGHVNSMTYTFEEKGEYLILCNEYCGIGHHMMSAELEVK